MPTYRLGGGLSTDTSDVSPFTESIDFLDTSTEPGYTVVGRSLNSGVTDEGLGFITLSGVPNSDAWEDGGTNTISFQNNGDNTTCNLSIRIISINSSGTILQTGSYGSPVTMGTSGSNNTVSCTSPTWSHTEACGNRLCIQLKFVDTRSHGSLQSYLMRTGQLSYYSTLSSSVSEDAGTCTAAAPRRIFVTFIN